MKVRKIPVIVEAFHFEDVSKVEGLLAFVGKDNIEGYTNTEEPKKPIPLYHIKTLEGDMKVSEGDWIIKGVNGEFYPCKPDIFAKTYEAVEDEPDNAPVARRSRVVVLKTNKVDLQFVTTVLHKAQAEFMSQGSNASHCEAVRRIDRENAKMCDEAVDIIRAAEEEGAK